MKCRVDLPRSQEPLQLGNAGRADMRGDWESKETDPA